MTVLTYHSAEKDQSTFVVSWAARIKFQASSNGMLNRIRGSATLVEINFLWAIIFSPDKFKTYFTEYFTLLVICNLKFNLYQATGSGITPAV